MAGDNTVPVPVSVLADILRANCYDVVAVRPERRRPGGTMSERRKRRAIEASEAAVRAYAKLAKEQRKKGL